MFRWIKSVVAAAPQAREVGRLANAVERAEPVAAAAAATRLRQMAGHERVGTLLAAKLGPDYPAKLDEACRRGRAQSQELQAFLDREGPLFQELALFLGHGTRAARCKSPAVLLRLLAGIKAAGAAKGDINRRTMVRLYDAALGFARTGHDFEVRSHDRYETETVTRTHQCWACAHQDGGAPCMGGDCGTPDSSDASRCEGRDIELVALPPTEGSRG